VVHDECQSYQTQEFFCDLEGKVEMLVEHIEDIQINGTLLADFRSLTMLYVTPTPPIF